MSSLNPVLQLLNNSQFNPSGDLSNWSIESVPQPPVATLWNSSTLLPANGSGGNIPFPTWHSLTPAAYTAPSANAPPGNAAFTGYASLSAFGGALYALPPLVAGGQYTVTISFAGNPSAANLGWYYSVNVNVADGVLGTSPIAGAMTKFDPTAGWQTFTFTFTAAFAFSGPTFEVLGGGTDGTVGYQSSVISGASVLSPMLIGNVTVTSPSQGSRFYPPSALNVGTYTGSVMSGGDARVPRLDGSNRLRPREETIEFELLGTWSSGIYTIEPAKPVMVSAKGCFITALTISAYSMSSGAKMVFDITVNGVSIFPGATAASLPFIQSAEPNAPGIASTGYFSEPNFYIGGGNGDDPVYVNIAGQIISITGSIINPIIRAVIYHP